MEPNRVRRTPKTGLVLIEDSSRSHQTECLNERRVNMQKARPVGVLSFEHSWPLIMLATVAIISAQEVTRSEAFISSAACHEMQLEFSGRQSQLNTTDQLVAPLDDPNHNLENARRLRRAAQTSGRPDVTRVVAVSGQTIEFQCPLAGELLEQTHANAAGDSARHQPKQRIIWRKDGQPLSQMNSTRLRLGQLSSNLTILQAQSRLDEATYECALLQEAGGEPANAKLHQFQLRLLVAPRLAPFEFPASAQVGMKVLLTCSALEGQQPISFVWLRDGQIIGRAGGQSAGEQVAAAPSSGVSTLGQLHQQQLADKFALSAQSSVSLSDRSQYVVINDGEPAQAAAAADAEHAELLKSGQAMQLADASIRIRQADDYSILSIEPLELKHSGRYTCSAQNEAARVSHSSQLVINAPPTLTIEPKDGDLVSGRSLVIDCAASGQPRPQLSWSRAREANEAKPWDFVPIYDNLRYAVLPNGSLAISNATQREQGLYMCSARNGFAPEVTKLIRITIHEPARIGPKFKLVEARVDEQAKMSCEAQGEPPLALAWLDKEGKVIDKSDKRFIIDDDPTTSPRDEPLEPAGGKRQVPVASSIASSSLLIARAARSHSGHYTCQATNKHGQDKMVANLLVQDVPDKVNELKVTNVTASTISLRWQLGFAGNSPVTSYLVQYQSDDPLDDLLMSAAKTSSSTTATTTSAAAVAGSTDSPASVSQPVKLYRHLFGGGSSAAPTFNSAQDKEQTSSIKEALETLNSLSSSLSDLSITSADEAIDRTLVELTVQQTATSLTIKELNPYCVYRLRLAGINKIGLGEFSDWIRAKTEEAPPSGSALKIAAAATGPNSVKLSWFPPDRRTWNGQLARFQIGYRPIDSTYELNKSIEWTPPSLMQSIMLDVNEKRKQQQQQQQQHPASEPSAKEEPARLAGGNGTAPLDKSPYALRQHLRQLLAMQQQELVAHLTNLQRSTTYLVWVQAANGRGMGPQSHAVSVKTLDDVPPSAPALRIQSSSTNSITISWSMLSNFVSPANLYTLFYRRVPPSYLAPSGRQTPNSSHLFALDTRQQTGSFQEPPAAPPDQSFQERTISSHQLLAHNSLANSLANFRPHNSNQEPSEPAANQQFVYTLDQLDCGSVYELYMTTRNSVGKSEPSAVVTTRTLGEPPLAPSNKNNLFVRIGAQDVLLNLASWSTGGCPLTQVNVRYKQLVQPVSLAATALGPADQNVSRQANKHSLPSFSVAWPMSTSVPGELLEAINMQQQQRSGPSRAYLLEGGGLDHGHRQLSGAQFALKSLQPSTGYELEIVAHNAAGHTMAQYEFVTAGPNGTRSGYTRREGVFRLDQRGQPVETLAEQVAGAEQPIAAHPHQQQQFAPGGPMLQQLVPLVLVVLCFVCLVISSAFCYNRLAANCKQQRTRRGSLDGFRSICSGASTSGGGGDDAHSNAPKPAGPNWSGTRLRNAQSQLRGLHSELVDDRTPSSINTSSDSPPAPMNENQAGGFHYCARSDSNGAADSLQQHHHQLISATLNPKRGFSQSMSMRDFNAMNVPGGNATLSHNHHHQLIKSGRATLANPKLAGGSAGGFAQDFVKLGATTMARGRRALMDPTACAPHIALTEAHQYGNLQRVCPSNAYGQTLTGCKHKLDQIYDLYGPTQQSGACNYLQHNNNSNTNTSNSNAVQSHETSWTMAPSGAANDTDQPQATNYAIPAGYNQVEALADEPGQSYACDDLYGQGTIDACIQHLMQQQYQQEARSQPPYAMLNRHAAELIAGNSNRPCNMYADQEANLFGDLANINQIQQQQQQQEQAYDHQRATGTTNYTLNTQSVIESSSGSSGIGLESLTGASSQLDCQAANANPSNGASNRNYPQQVAAADQQQQQQPTSADTS